MVKGQRIKLRIDDLKYIVESVENGTSPQIIAIRLNITIRRVKGLIKNLENLKQMIKKSKLKENSGRKPLFPDLDRRLFLWGAQYFKNFGTHPKPCDFKKQTKAIILSTGTKYPQSNGFFSKERFLKRYYTFFDSEISNENFISGLNDQEISECQSSISTHLITESNFFDLLSNINQTIDSQEGNNSSLSSTEDHLDDYHQLSTSESNSIDAELFNPQNFNIQQFNSENFVQIFNSGIPSSGHLISESNLDSVTDESIFYGISLDQEEFFF